MRTFFRTFLSYVGDAFWLIPAVMVLAGALGAVGLVSIDRAGLVPQALLASPWLYNGGGTGARTLLGAVASSSIGVAGTVFSITIAALSLAAGQMGPRLLRNFTRDRGNQVTLGAFLATFSYALMVLRSVRTQNEGEFVPHLSLTVGIMMAFLCVATLVYFVGHMAGRINVDTVIQLVSEDVGSSIQRIGLKKAPDATLAPAFDGSAKLIADPRRGYVIHVDGDALADWLASNGIKARLLVRPGQYVFPGAAVAIADSEEGVADAIQRCSSLGSERVSSDDLEYSIRQLVEVAVRALSPGINDPHTALSALDRLGAALCDLASLYLPAGYFVRNGDCVLSMPSVDYDGLVDAMFHLIRQNAAGSATVLIRMIEVLTSVAGVERDAARLTALQRHASLLLTDAERDIANSADLQDLQARYRHFESIRMHGSASLIQALHA